MKGKTIVITDYGIGNVKSIGNALMNVGANVSLSNNEQEILDSDGLILPGVGAFAQAMENLGKYNLIDCIKAYVASGKPFLGICLGMQMLFSESEEFGLTDGLGIIPGRVIKIPCSDNNTKLPHIGWNEISKPSEESWKNTIFSSIGDKAEVYFVHSYVGVPLNKEAILSTTDYCEYRFCSTVRMNNVYGCQFHPEKSATIGLKILKNFVNLAGE